VPNRFIGKEERLPGRAPGSQFLGAAIELLDFLGTPVVQEAGEIRNPLEPKPGARGAVNGEVGKQFFGGQRGQLETASHLHALLWRLDPDARD
jgi:hypothetical protein